MSLQGISRFTATVFQNRLHQQNDDKHPVFKLSKKSDRDEFMLYLKLVSLGVLIIGMIGFLIKFISAAFPGYSDRSRGPLLSDRAY